MENPANEDLFATPTPSASMYYPDWMHTHFAGIVMRLHDLLDVALRMQHWELHPKPSIRGAAVAANLGVLEVEQR